MQVSTEKFINKFDNYVLFSRLTEDYNPGYNLSDSSEGLSKEVREKKGYTGFFAGGVGEEGAGNAVDHQLH